jgi:hypothetical protein
MAKTTRGRDVRTFEFSNWALKDTLSEMAVVRCGLSKEKAKMSELFPSHNLYKQSGE